MTAGSRTTIAWGLGLGAALALGSCGTAPPEPRSLNGPPAIAQVRDGLGADVDSQDVRSSLFANWDDFVDPEGEPVVYEWCIGNTTGGQEILAWTQVGGATRAFLSGLELPTGVPLHVSVRARDLHGNRSATATSDGVVVGERALATPSSTGIDPVPAAVGHLAAIEHFGTTWTFDRPVQSGRFANGDWWVVGPVNIVGITPASVRDGARVRHGSMLNPDPKVHAQGYDSAMFGDGARGRFDPALNVGLGVSRKEPLVLAPGTSLVTATSAPEAGHLPQLESCAVLTCLAQEPPAGAFRPPYVGTDKTCRWNVTALDLKKLGSLETVPGAPELPELVGRFERTWLDHIQGWTGRYLHPRRNMPDYGRDLADLVGQAALALQLDRPDAEKVPLAIQLVQLGIDNYGIVQNGGRFLADGGSGSGRKFPVLFAGAVLGCADLLRCAREPAFAFAEDAQTFVVEEKDGVVNGGHGGYTVDDVGLPEWGNRHRDDPRHDVKIWTGDPYRRCCTANAWLGYVLATRIMGLKEAWGHDPL
ncbi:MAG: hypothetical protein JNK15_24645, partial [Planctomycetes bacterium]|nr:hypothetical protein [Planctomycetota bacterium]